MVGGRCRGFGPRAGCRSDRRAMCDECRDFAREVGTHWWWFTHSDVIVGRLAKRTEYRLTLIQQERRI